jgi:DNA repair exonuclease SbcCD ATPase subunit
MGTKAQYFTMIIFKTLKWKNFLSTGDTWTELDLERHKSTLVVGDNGAGKSTFLDALSYGLYGKPFRRINKPQLINAINRKALEVEVNFKVGKHSYVIKRGMKPSKFEIYQNGKMINQDAAARDYQDYLEKQILKLTHKSFSQIVVLGSSTFVPFMQLSAMHRREVIEDLLDLQIFSIMNTLLKDKVADNDENLKKCDNLLGLIDAKIKLTQEHIADMQADNVKKINDTKVQIKENNAEIKALKGLAMGFQEKVDVLTKSIEDLNTIKDRYEKLKTIRIKLSSKLKDYQSEITFFEDHDNCPTCNQDIDEQFKCDTVKSKEDQLEETRAGIEKLQQELEVAESRISEISSVQSEIQINQSSITEKTWQVNNLQNTNQKLTQDIENLSDVKTSKNKDVKQLAKFNDEKEAGERAKITLVNDRNTLSIISFILKDTGIKTRIIKQYVPIMNKLINKYLAAMDFFVQFELDEGFNETIKSRYRDEFSYASFSEGEKMRIDLALLFTWRAVAKIRNSASTNLLIMDEVFDSSLDTSGTDEFLKILNELTSDTNVFIISHKGDQLIDKFNNVVRFEKYKNFSRIAA